MRFESSVGHGQVFIVWRPAAQLYGATSHALHRRRHASRPDRHASGLQVTLRPAARNWDLGAGSSMTNGTVAKVDRVSAEKLTVKYRGGEKTIAIAPSTKIVALAAGNRDELKPGTKAFIPISGSGSQGSLQATRMTIGSGGMAPPM